MNAPTPQSAFARIRTASDPQPTIAESYMRWIKSLPVADQIKHVQAIVTGEDWIGIDYQDSLKLDRVLANFATDMDEFAHAEDVRMHGPVDQTRYYL